VNVQVFDEATVDLVDGYHFYERQAEGLGDYFLDSLWSDINSLRLYAGIHVIYHGYYRLLSRRFPCAQSKGRDGVFAEYQPGGL
jgi:hypothetical protein